MTAIGNGVVLDAGEGRRVGVARDTLTFKGASEADHFSVARLTRGAFVLVPRDAAHTFANAGTSTARWIGIFAPAQYEHLVEELGAILPQDSPPDLAAVAALFAKWDTEIVVEVES